jgi:hypothetical protein
MFPVLITVALKVNVPPIWAGEGGHCCVIEMPGVLAPGQEELAELLTSLPAHFSAPEAVSVSAYGPQLSSGTE